MLGSAPQLSVGADSTIAPLFAAGIARLAPTGSANYLALVSLLAVTVGVLVAIVGLLRLGWIADFLSAPIITGFLAGVAVIIVVHQLPDLFALAPVSGSTVHRVSDVVRHLGRANGGPSASAWPSSLWSRRRSASTASSPGRCWAWWAPPSWSPSPGSTPTGSRCSGPWPTAHRTWASLTCRCRHWAR